MRKLYGNLKMTWFRVILFAVLVGLYTGAVMLFPALENTSIQDIGIYYEWWVIFAVIIVVNCSKWWEAMLKCFVFFLISQPLVYLVEILAGTLSFDQGLGYYCSMWLPMTFLTLPGGCIAYFCKKQNSAGAVILGLGNTIQTALAAAYLEQAIKSFPHHLLSGMICIASVIIMSLCIQKKRKNQLIAIAVPIVLTGVLLVLLRITGRSLF